MFHGTQPGWIEVISGVMFAGKSEELIRRVRRSVIARKKVQVFKSHLDDRYAGVFTVASHDGTLVEAEPVSTSLDIMARVRPDTEVVAVDEAQFLDAGIVTVANTLAGRGIRVILVGTDSDFRGEGFGAMPQLMAAAEIVDKLYAICVVCGGPATRNQRLINGRPAPYDSPQIMVGGREAYEARCRHCHVVPRKDEGQGALLLMLTVAVTGNIAAGKSAVVDLFRSWGATVIDTDILAREAVAPGQPALAALAQRFGSDLVLPDGTLDRAALRRRVMGDAALRRDLNAIVHPAVMRRTGDLVDEARRRGDTVVVLDIPLLFEVLDPADFDVVVLVDAPAALRRERLMTRRGLAAAEADALIAAQLPSAEKRARSHLVIDNDGTRDALEMRAGAAWQQLVERARNFA